MCVALQSNYQIPFKIIHTGQHYDDIMSDVFFRELKIPAPAYNLSVGSGNHGTQTGKMMIKLEEIFLQNNFSGIVVIGDVNSTVAGALVGAKLGIPVIHVESGLRSFNKSMPEEINRIATDHISDLLFAPTHLAMDNLKNEGLEKIAYYSGDVMYDMILHGLEMAKTKSTILETLKLTPKNYYLATLHRPYNVDEPDQLKAIVAGLNQVEQPIILAAHPRLKKNLEKFNISFADHVHITKPFGYFDFVKLQANASKVITDSGGVQKEAFFLKTPCITLRSETEWVETVSLGANILVRERTSQNILDAIGQEQVGRFDEKPYGDGKASHIMIKEMQNQGYC